MLLFPFAVQILKAECFLVGGLNAEDTTLVNNKTESVSAEEAFTTVSSAHC